MSSGSETVDAGDAVWALLADDAISPPLVDAAAADDDVMEQMHAAGLTDGLPVVPPTRGRVWRMLRFGAPAAAAAAAAAAATTTTTTDPDRVVGRCAPSYNPATVKLCAMAAVMAGCEPRQLPVVLAAVAAMTSDRFNLHGVSATTMGATPCLIVNGPARAAAGLSSGIGALGSGNRANAAVGRAVKLVLLNVGQGRLGGTESTTIGSALKFTMCLAENEEFLAGTSGSGGGSGSSDSGAAAADDSAEPVVGWEPLHTMTGCGGGRGEFNRGDGAVTVLAVTGGPTQLVDFNTTDAARLIELLASVMVPAMQPSMPLLNEGLLVVSPEHATTLARGGVRSKAQLVRRLMRACNVELTKHATAMLRYLLLPKLVAGLAAKLGARVARLLDLALSCCVALLLARVSPRAAVGTVLLTLLGGSAGGALRLRMWSVVLGAAVRVMALLGLDPLGALGITKFTDGGRGVHVVVAGAGSGKFSQFYPGFGIGKLGMATAHLSSSATVAVGQAPASAPGHLVGDGAAPAVLPTRPVGVSANGAAVVLDPRARAQAVDVPPVPRRAALEAAGGRVVVGLLDISKGNGCHFLDRLEQRFLGLRLQPPMKSISVRRYVKPTFSRPAPPDLRARILAECTHVVTALGD